MSMGEREKGHELGRCDAYGQPHRKLDFCRNWTPFASLEAQPTKYEAGMHVVDPQTGKCDLCGKEVMSKGASPECRYVVSGAAHPSAGQSERWKTIKPWGGDATPENVAYLVDTLLDYESRLAESRAGIAKLREELVKAGNHIGELDEMVQLERAAMREEAAKVLCVWCRDGHPVEEVNAVITANGEPFWHKVGENHIKCKAAKIRSLPADSSALDARDARVRRETLEAAAAECDEAQIEARQRYAEQYGVLPEQLMWWNDLITNVGDRIRMLAQRSAEKGKGQ